MILVKLVEFGLDVLLAQCLRAMSRSLPEQFVVVLGFRSYWLQFWDCLLWSCLYYCSLWCLWPPFSLSCHLNFAAHSYLVSSLSFIGALWLLQILDRWFLCLRLDLAQDFYWHLRRHLTKMVNHRSSRLLLSRILASFESQVASCSSQF